MRSRENAAEPLVGLADITEIELRIQRRMREFTMGEHPGSFQGHGFDYVGLREWQAGDRFEAIDWPQSSLTAFSPLVVREFEQPATSTVMIVADRSASALCGRDGVTGAAIVARAVATLGLSAVFFQDAVGLVTFESWSELRGLRPRIGKAQVVHCLDAYQHGQGLQTIRPAQGLGATLGGFLRRTSMVPVVSDFLVEDAGDVLRELAWLGSVHDVFLALVEASFAFELDARSAAWVDTYDLETGEPRLMSRREVRRLRERVRQWQDHVATSARDLDLDVVRLEPDVTAFDLALAEFVAERRLRKRRM